MVDIARRHFGLAPDDERLRVVVGDGGAYVHSHPQSCDAMLVDVGDSGFRFPEHMAGEAFCRACHDALRADGVLAVNLFGGSDAWIQQHARMLEPQLRLGLPAFWGRLEACLTFAHQGEHA